jgi:hypothetical protein
MVMRPITRNCVSEGQLHFTWPDPKQDSDSVSWVSQSHETEKYVNGSSGAWNQEWLHYRMPAAIYLTDWSETVVRTLLLSKRRNISKHIKGHGMNKNMAVGLDRAWKQMTVLAKASKNLLLCSAKARAVKYRNIRESPLLEDVTKQWVCEHTAHQIDLECAVVICRLWRISIYAELYLSRFPTKTVYTFLISRYGTCPTNLIHLHLTILIICKGKAIP